MKKIVIGTLIGFFFALIIEYAVVRFAQSGNFLIAAQYIKRVGYVSVAADGAFFGALTGFLLKLAKDKKR